MTKTAYLIGIGMGNPKFLSDESKKIIQTSKIVAGASRILDCVKDFIQNEVFCSYNSLEIAKKFDENCSENVCAVFSGDIGFFSGATKLSQMLSQNGWNVIFVSGTTSFQYLASKLCENWQDWNLVSAHGLECNFGAEIAFHKKTFFLTGGKISAKTILDFIIENEIDSKVVVASNLSYENEKITKFDFNFPLKKDIIIEDFSNLAVVFVERNETESDKFSKNALPDFVFERNLNTNEKLVPMTKQVIRSAILSFLNIKDGEIVWDVGAGTGAVSIDLARNAKCQVFGIEEKENAFNLEKINRKKFGAYNLSLVHGKAPFVLENLPNPNAVFIGGSEGQLEEIVSLILSKNEKSRILISSVTAETFAECVMISKKFNLSFEYTQISVSKSSKIGNYNLLKSENPVFLIFFKCDFLKSVI